MATAANPGSIDFRSARIEFLSATDRLLKAAEDVRKKRERLLQSASEAAPEEQQKSRAPQ